MRENGELCFVWPLLTYRRALWRYLLPLGSDAADYTGPLVEDRSDTAMLVERAWKAARTQCKADLIRLPYMDEGSAIHRLAQREKHILNAQRDSCWIANLREYRDWAIYTKSVGALFNKKPGQLKRRLAKEGKLEVYMMDPKDRKEIAEVIHWMLGIKREWAEKVNKKGEWLFSQHYENFLIATLTFGGDDAPSRIHVVKFNDVLIAACIMSHGNPLATGVISGFDLKYSQYKPGSIAWETAIKWAFEQGYDVDFCPGSEKYKDYWTRGNRSHTWSMHVANSTWGFFGYRGATTVKRLIAAVKGLKPDSKEPTAESGRTGSSPQEPLSE
jgi:CelD/BcsL family acetyltransferase involved in cellulose biosynthesis